MLDKNYSVRTFSWHPERGARRRKRKRMEPEREKNHFAALITLCQLKCRVDNCQGLVLQLVQACKSFSSGTVTYPQLGKRPLYIADLTNIATIKQ